MLWPDDKRARYASVRERMADGAAGRRMRRIKGALYAHAAIRAQGRIPGAEGRAAIQLNRAARKRDREEGKGWRIGHTDLCGV